MKRYRNVVLSTDYKLDDVFTLPEEGMEEFDAVEDAEEAVAEGTFAEEAEAVGEEAAEEIEEAVESEE